jgi:hypothetical protein
VAAAEALCFVVGQVEDTDSFALVAVPDCHDCPMTVWDFDTGLIANQDVPPHGFST